MTTYASGLVFPAGLAFDTGGDLFAANRENTTVEEITPGGTVTTFASGLNNPDGLAFDSNGNLFAINLADNTISEIAPDGTVSSFASGFDAPTYIAFQPAPEPSTLALAGLGAFAFARQARNCLSHRRRNGR